MRSRGAAAGALAVTAGAVVLGMLLSVGSYFGGDQLVLAASKARPVDATSAPQLINIVQELSIAAGIPMPKVYVIDDTAPNAFATGRDPKHASIAVTSGLLEKLDREELQGVIGHELSPRPQLRHPVRAPGRRARWERSRCSPTCSCGTRSGAAAGGGTGTARAAAGGCRRSSSSLPSCSRSSRRSSPRLVQLAVSRQREYLADASSVDLTRNPHGLERALAMIATDKEVLEVANRATQHLYFTNPIKKFEARRAGCSRPIRPSPTASTGCASSRAKGRCRPRRSARWPASTESALGRASEGPSADRPRPGANHPASVRLGSPPASHRLRVAWAAQALGPAPRSTYGARHAGASNSGAKKTVARSMRPSRRW